MQTSLVGSFLGVHLSCNSQSVTHQILEPGSRLRWFTPTPFPCSLFPLNFSTFCCQMHFNILGYGFLSASFYKPYLPSAFSNTGWTTEPPLTLHRSSLLLRHAFCIDSVLGQMGTLRFAPNFSYFGPCTCCYNPSTASARGYCSVLLHCLSMFISSAWCLHYSLSQWPHTES